MLTEAIVAAAASSWLKEQGWTVYSEVSLDRHLRENHPLGDARADSVGTRGQQTCVVESKLSISWELLAQAKRWLPYADRVWICVPNATFTDGRREALDVARNYYGLGVLEYGDAGVVERIQPRAHRRQDDALLVSLDPGHQTHAAPGTNEGGQFTEFARTKDRLAEYVRANPPPNSPKLEEALAAIGHHYRDRATAVREMRKQIRAGRVPGVKFGWKQRLEPDERRDADVPQSEASCKEMGP